MTDLPKAVFLSYASQDAGPALRISEALRAAGIEVWFDQSELRGGDAWDSKIRRQIRECALFVPVISAHTQERLEGYFRREWRLAVDRTQDMAEGKPFLLPVVVDDTAERDAHVPEAFRTVQWTRLQDGETSPAFAQHVARLLSPGAMLSSSRPVASSHASTARAYETSSGTATSARETATSGWRPSPTVLVIAVLVIVAGYFALDKFMLSERSAPPSLTGESGGAPPPPPATPSKSDETIAAPAKSIAVLPFVDMSEKRDQEFFSDGLAEELLDMLAKVPDLQVIARTSSFSFKGKSDDVRAIGQKLSVANILEGSVRKSGRRVRITTQLVRTDTGTHIWSETYDRDVKDVFQVQDEIASAVVEKLKITLLNPVPSAPTRTENSDAHMQYLQGQYYFQQDSRDGLAKAVEFYKRALALDQTYAPAWASLSWAYNRQVANGYAMMDATLPKAVEAANNAIRYDPNFGFGYAALALTQIFGKHAWAEGAANFSKAVALDPGNAISVASWSHVERAIGHEAKALELSRQAIELDPLNLVIRKYHARTLLHAGRLEEAEREMRKVLDLNPALPGAHHDLGRILLAEGRSSEALAEFEAESDPGWHIFGPPLGLHAVGRDREAQAAFAKLLADPNGSEFQVAELYAYLGNADKALEWLDIAYEKRDPGFFWVRGDPAFKSLGKYPRFQKVLDRVK